MRPSLITSLKQPLFMPPTSVSFDLLRSTPLSIFIYVCIRICSSVSSSSLELHESRDLIYMIHDYNLKGLASRPAYSQHSINICEMNTRWLFLFFIIIARQAGSLKDYLSLRTMDAAKGFEQRSDAQDQ